MKVCVVYDAFSSYKNRGGAEEQMDNSIGALKEMGVELTFYDFNPKTIEQCDIVHFYKSLYWYWPIAEFCVKIQKPYVVTPVFYVSDFYNLFQYKLLSLLKIRGIFKISEVIKLWDNATCIFPNTSAEAKQILDYSNSKNVKLVLNCISDSFFNTSIGNEKTQKIESFDLLSKEYILNIARVEPRKNQLRLARAARKLGYELVVVGPIGDKSYFEKLLMYKNVRYLGEIWDPVIKKHLIMNSKVFALPSLLETPGISALEAKFYKKNILLTKIGVGNDYYDKYEGVKFVNPKSTIDITNKLRSLVSGSLFNNSNNAIPIYREQMNIVFNEYKNISND